VCLLLRQQTNENTEDSETRAFPSSLPLSLPPHPERGAVQSPTRCRRGRHPAPSRRRSWGRTPAWEGRERGREGGRDDTDASGADTL
jgi:hypothetical protein